MRVLICISKSPQTKRTLVAGVQIAQSFGADISVLYVDTHQRMTFSHSIRFSRNKLSEWELEHPGVKRLRFAREVLAGLGVIRERDDALDLRHPLRPEIQGAYEIHFYGDEIQNIRLRLREGRLIDQIRREVEENPYDVTIIGGVDQVGNTRRLIQFVDTSFVVVNYFTTTGYDLLFCSDLSDTANRALMFGAKVAKAMDVRMDVLRVVDQKSARESDACVSRADTLLRRGGIEHDILIEEGDLVETILRVADEKYAIVMGTSHRSELLKFILGSTPIKIVQRATTHVIVVR